jgi:hypothetical protein
MVTGARDRAMYTIELTQGPGWDAPALRSRPVKTTVDIERVTALAVLEWTRCNAHPVTGRCPMAGGSSMGLGAG